MTTAKEANPAKHWMVQELKQQLSGSSYLFLAQFTGMNVIQQDELRKRLDAASAGYRVVKNALLARAAKEIGLTVDASLTGQTAIIFGCKKSPTAQTDPVAAAKVLRGYMKEFEKPQYKLGGAHDAGRPAAPGSVAGEIARAVEHARPTVVVRLERQAERVSRRVEGVRGKEPKGNHR
jgi:ribosomal protein L10